MLPWLRPVPPRGNHHFRAASLQIVEQPVRVERLVAGEGREREAIEKRRHPCEVVRLAGEDHEAHKASERVHDRHDLARQAAPGTADPLPAGPPLAPDAFWCAWTTVPSTNTHSRSNSSENVLKTRSKTPESVQRRNRM